MVDISLTYGANGTVSLKIWNNRYMAHEPRPETNYKGAYLYLVKWIRGLPFDLDESDREKLRELGMDYPKKYNHLKEKP